MREYLVVPGYITSKADGDLHYVNANELIRLYGVDPRECVIWKNPPSWITEPYIKGLIVLNPRYDGDYSLESAYKRHQKHKEGV